MIIHAGLFLAEIFSLQTDTAELLMPLVNRLVVGLIISAIILGASRDCERIFVP